MDGSIVGVGSFSEVGVLIALLSDWAEDACDTSETQIPGNESHRTMQILSSCG
jgi:hypothetical protein